MEQERYPRIFVSTYCDSTRALPSSAKTIRQIRCSILKSLTSFLIISNIKKNIYTTKMVMILSVKEDPAKHKKHKKK